MNASRTPISSSTVVALITALVVACVLGVVVGWFGLLGAVAIIVVIGGVYGAKKPLLLLPLLLFVTVLGQVGRILPGGSGSSVLVLDALTLLLAGLAALYWISHPQTLRPRIGTTKTGTVWLGLLAVAIATWLLTPLQLSRNEMLTDGLYWMRLLGYSSVSWVVASLSSSSNLSRKLLTGLFWVVGSVAVIGFLQLYVFPDIGVLNKFGWDPHVGRLVSTFLDPNYLGGFFAIGIAALGGYIFVYRPRSIWPWVGVGALLLATVLTYSRSGYIAVLVVVALLGLRYSWKLLMLATLVSIPLGLSIPRVQERIVGGFSIDSTSRDRIDSWWNALDIADTYQPLGLGYNHYRPAQEIAGVLEVGSNGRSGAGSDSTLLNMLTTMGPVGVTLFMLLLFCITMDAHRASLRTEADPKKVVGIALMAVLPAFFLHSFFVNAFVFPFVLLPLCVLIGILYRPDVANA